jgi:hypothetical protein
MSRFTAVERDFFEWCRELGYTGGLLFHGSTRYGMALPTSDIDVIFDSRRQLSRMVHSARRHPKMQPFGLWKKAPGLIEEVRLVGLSSVIWVRAAMPLM